MYLKSLVYLETLQSRNTRPLPPRVPGFSLFLKVQCPTPPSQRVGWTFRKVQGPTPPSRRVDWTSGKVQGPTPPKGSKRPSKSAASRRKMCVFKGFPSDFYGISTRLEGRFDFLKSPKSKPPLREGRLDFSKSPRSNPPLLEGPLEISNRPRSMGGGPSTRRGVVQSDPRIIRRKVE